MNKFDTKEFLDIWRRLEGQFLIDPIVTKKYMNQIMDAPFGRCVTVQEQAVYLKKMIARTEVWMLQLGNLQILEYCLTCLKNKQYSLSQQI